MNRKTLLALGAGQKETERFLNNNVFSPSEQTAFVLNLRSLNGVANRGAFVRAAGETSSDESDAIFCVQTATLMSKIHKDKPLARLAMIGDFPICVAKDGTISSASMGLRCLDVGRGCVCRRRAKTHRSIWQKQKYFCRAVRAGFTAIATGIGEPRFHGAGSTRSRSA
jgi:hypothetical protein